MIFAEIEEQANVKDILEVLEKEFGIIEWGDQGSETNPDAYFWIYRNDVRVAVDNLTSLNFQVKCVSQDNVLVKEVITLLGNSYRVKIFDKPEFEAHEN